MLAFSRGLTSRNLFYFPISEFFVMICWRLLFVVGNRGCVWGGVWPRHVGARRVQRLHIREALSIAPNDSLRTFYQSNRVQCLLSRIFWIKHLTCVFCFQGVWPDGGRQDAHDAGIEGKPRRQHPRHREGIKTFWKSSPTDYSGLLSVTFLRMVLIAFGTRPSVEV